jgi:hypothetical protein
VTDFGDVERFARSHSACGGITPEATTQTGGGYLLTLTCACGATMDRWVTPEEARIPLPLAAPSAASAPARPAAPAKAPEKPKPEPSIDLEAALREAVEAEDATGSKPRPAPAASPSRSPDLDEALRLAVEADVPAAKPPVAPAPPPPPHVPISNLEEAVQRALEEDARAAAAAAATTTRPRQRAVTPLNLDATVQRAVESQAAASPVQPATTSRFWFVTIVVVLVIGGFVFWLGLRALDEEARRESREPDAAPVAAPSASEVERAAFAEVLRALKDLQAASTSTVPYAAYSSRVAFAKADVDRYLGTAAAPQAKADVRDTMELHVLAAAAWRARTLDSKDAWEAVGQDPAIDLCPSARQVIDFAETPAGRSRAHARGLSVAGAIPLLWECAGARLNALDRASSG